MAQQKLTDRALAKLGFQYEEVKAEEAEVKARKKSITERVVAEFKRRNSKAIENSGIRLTIVEPEEIVYYADKLDRLLEKGKITKKQHKRMFKRVPDKTAISAMVLNGEVDAKLIKKCSDIIPKAAYIQTSIQKGKA